MELPPTLDIRLLEGLVALISEGSVTRAAARMSISQPRMSNALARLRQLTGDPLLVRSGQRLVPTPRALEIASLVQTSLTGLKDALSPTTAFEPQNSQQLFVLAMSDYVAGILLPPITAAIERAAPHVVTGIKAI